MTYTATVSREDGWWMIHVPEIDGLTQARRLVEAETMARELIAVTLGVPLDTVTVDIQVTNVADIDIPTRLNAIRADRARAAELERAASADAASLARDLVSARVPLRDVGAILGISHQRAHQLIRQ